MPQNVKRVLLVEDERHIRILVGSILRRKGYVTVEASNGLEALRCLHSEPPFHLIITDLNMPELSGVDLLQEVRRNHPDIPIIVISAYTATDWAKEALEHAVIALQKPFSHAQLVNIVSDVLQ